MNVVHLTSRDDNADISIKKRDRHYVRNINTTLFEQGFNVYLNTDSEKNSGEKIDLYAVNRYGYESVKNQFVSMLKSLEKRTGSDQWIHFGFVIQRVVGLGIKDFFKGSHFYCTHLPNGKNISRFKLEAAIYDGRIPPTPIQLNFIDSLEGLEVIC